MVMGFVFIRVESKEEVKVYRKLTKIPEIKELSPLFGEFDLLAKVEARDFNVLSRIVLNRIRTLKGVIETKTLPGTKI